MAGGPRVLGIDPGTVSIDLCATEGGRLVHAASLPTLEVGTDPRALRRELERLGGFDLVAAPSGYGLPLVRGEDVDERLLRLAFLARPGLEAGILGIRRAVADLLDLGQPLVFLPGVVHLPTVPSHRKVNRIDLGTADKVCSAALAIADVASHRAAAPAATSLILVEMGGAFTSVLAVEEGAIVDGIGGTSGPLGFKALGALDGEVAALAGAVPKTALFTGGAAWIAGDPGLDAATWEARATAPSIRDDHLRARLAWEAYTEGVVKAVAAMWASAPSALDIVLSGRLSRLSRLVDDLVGRLGRFFERTSVRTAAASIERVAGESSRAVAPEAALGAALIADGLCGGSGSAVVNAMRLREASGTLLDHLAWPLGRDAAQRFLSEVSSAAQDSAAEETSGGG